MKEVPVKLGPLALLLTVISICLTTMAILNFTTAKADKRLADKYAQTVQERYELEQEGQRYLADTSDEMAMGIESVPDADGIVRQVIEQNDTRLHIGIRPDRNGSFAVTSWRIERQWVEDNSMGNLWSGF